MIRFLQRLYYRVRQRRAARRLDRLMTKRDQIEVQIIAATRLGAFYQRRCLQLDVPALTRAPLPATAKPESAYARPQLVAIQGGRS